MRLLRPCQGCAAKTLRPATDALPGLRCRGFCQATDGGGLSAQRLWLVRDRFSWPPPPKRTPRRMPSLKRPPPPAPALLRKKQRRAQAPPAPAAVLLLPRRTEF